ncbi:hypothetical protein NDU88_000454 [Pleurodeles waltl]|uniref:Uncharacterized protein n=1 Tax=Pleurodeles waltl TaxID=8319 RepID=A0AAV7SX15_PLEWA|nr:hypothetical protein NDU88_000454 [Pleurodeles waltl]
MPTVSVPLTLMPTSHCFSSVLRYTMPWTALIPPASPPSQYPVPDMTPLVPLRDAIPENKSCKETQLLIEEEAFHNRLHDVCGPDSDPLDLPCWGYS